MDPSQAAQHLQEGRPVAPPEDLALVAPGRDRLTAVGWTSGVLLVGLIILLLAR